MTDALIKQGMSADDASAIPAIYFGQHSGRVVDIVVVIKGVETDNLTIPHEFVHRAAEMRGLLGKDKPYQNQMWEILGYPEDKLDALKQSDPKEYQRVLRDTKGMIRVFNEGLNQWATIFLAERTDSFPKPIDKRHYADEIADVRETFESTLNVSGLTHSSDQIDEIMLDLALTGDFSRLKATLPAGEDRHKISIDDNFFVAELMRLANIKFQLRRLDRFSKMLETT